jgi:hypothetical protein
VQDVGTSLSATLVHDHIAIFSITVIGVPEPFFNAFDHRQIRIISDIELSQNGQKSLR